MSEYLETLSRSELENVLLSLGGTDVGQLRRDELIDAIIELTPPEAPGVHSGLRYERPAGIYYTPESVKPTQPGVHSGLRYEYPAEIYYTPESAKPSPTYNLPPPPPTARQYDLPPPPPATQRYNLPPPPPATQRYNLPPPSPPVSEPIADLYNQVKLVVFDFDCTLTKKHSNRADIANIKALFTDRDLIEILIRHLRRTGRFVAIASYGYKDVILAAMDDIFGESSPFSESNVITPIDIANMYDIDWPEFSEPPVGSPYNKNTMLKLLADDHDLEPDEVLLIDDSLQNVRNARNAGYLAIHIKACGNLTQSAYIQLAELVHDTPPRELNTNFNTLWNEFLNENV